MTPKAPLCHTDVTILYAVMKAQLKHERRLVSLAEIYPYCRQDPKNVRWIMSRLRNNHGLVASQRVSGIGVMWTWCGRTPLPAYLLRLLEHPEKLKARTEKASRMTTVKDMLVALRKMTPQPEAAP